jgi:hypothetical protein
LYIEEDGIVKGEGKKVRYLCEILIINLKNLRSYIKKILNWLRDLDFVAEDRERGWAVVNEVMNCPVHKVIGIS